MSVQDNATREIRLAVVLNGGVSLAVWMGGAAQEIDRLTRPTGPYSGLLAWLRHVARVDVIAGTSAGGINGAALALVKANPAASMATLRDVWVEQGDLEEMFSTPFRGAPSSVLRGDDYFLAQLSEAMLSLARARSPLVAGVPGDDETTRDDPIDLSITTTLLRPIEVVSVDDLGAAIPQNIHESSFRFRRVVRGGDGTLINDFAPGQLETTARRLALASRCTSSFPVAFEPSFVPLRPGGAPFEGTTPQWREQHPDMTPVMKVQADRRERADGAGGADGTTDRSRFVSDGGILANMPTQRALEAIAEIPPGRTPVERVVLLVHPHISRPAPLQPDSPGKPPDTVDALLAVQSALTSQGQRSHEEEIERHNQRVASRRGTREDILRQLADQASPTNGGQTGSTPVSPIEGLERLTDLLYPHYRRLRRDRAGRDVALSSRREGYSENRIRRLACTAQESWLVTRDLPYAPWMPPSGAAEFADLAHRPGWRRGISGALGVAEGADHLLRLVQERLAAGPQGSATPESETIRVCRTTVRDARQHLLDIRREFNAVWDRPALRDLAPSVAYFLLRQTAYEYTMTDPERWPSQTLREAVQAAVAAGGTPLADRAQRCDAALAELISAYPVPGTQGRRVNEHLVSVAGAVATCLPLFDAVPSTGPHDVLQVWKDLLAPYGAPAATRLIVQRLLCLDVVTSTLGDEPSQGALNEIETVLMSGWTEPAFANRRKGPIDKLGGMSLGHFGGLLKRSWRVNDWIWGRLDAATVLCRLLLTPERLRAAVTVLPGEEEARAESLVIDQLMVPLFGAEVTARILADPPFTERHLVRLREEFHAAKGELTALLRAHENDLPPVPSVAALAAWGIALGILEEDTGCLTQAVLADHARGANGRSHGELFLQQAAAPLESISAAVRAGQPASRFDLLAVLDAFDRVGIGAESLSEESSSDQFLRIAATGVAAAATVVDSERSGLNAVRPLTRAIRGLAMLPYWIVRGLTAGGTGARTLALLGLSAGGTVFALSVLGILPAALAPSAAAVGGGAVLAAFGYSALRAGTVLHGLVLLSPVVPLLFWAVQRAMNGQGTWHGVSTVLVVLVISVGLMVLGSLPVPLHSVLGTIDAAADRRHLGSQPQTRRRILAVALAARPWVLGGLAVAAALWLISWLDRATTWAGVVDALHAHWWAVVLVGLALLGMSLEVARRQGETLRVVGAEPDHRLARLTDPSGITAGWSVLYGASYLIGTCGLLLWPGELLAQRSWGRLVVITGLAFGLTLLLVVPWWLPVRARRRIMCQERRRVVKGGALGFTAQTPPEEIPVALLHDLLARHRSYRFLVSPPAPGQHAVGLTAAGLALVAAAEQAVRPGSHPSEERRPSSPAS